MKSKFIIAFFIGSAICTSAMADVVKDILEQLTYGQAYICRKASLFDFKFSIRSGRGKACTNEVVASFAELICKGYKAPGDSEHYNNSHCAKNAKVVLKGRSPISVLFSYVKSAGIGVAGLICNAVETTPVLGTLCTLIKKKDTKKEDDDEKEDDDDERTKEGTKKRPKPDLDEDKPSKETDENEEPKEQGSL